MMTPSLSRFCVRLTSIFVKNSLPSCSLYFRTIHRQGFCRTYSDIKVHSENETFDDFDDSQMNDDLFSNIDFAAVCENDPEKTKKLKVMLLELSMQLSTKSVIAPKKVTSEQWKIIMNLKSERLRLNYLKQLYVREKNVELKTALKKFKKEVYLEQVRNSKNLPKTPPTTCSPINYSLLENTLFFRIYPREMMKRYNFEIALSMMFGSDLIIDCSYEDYMNKRENMACARQILYMWSENRQSINPFNLMYCNLNPDGKIRKNLKSLMPPFSDDEILMNYSEKHYLDMYSPDQLVYLTPHCKEMLEEFDHSKTYIIGGYVDEIINKPISLAKAKRDGLKTAKLPLDKYLNWAQGSKLLPINQCVRIMHDLKNGACWQYALRHVAVRKQVFQFLDNDISPHVSDELAAAYVQDSVNRSMLRDLNITKAYDRKRDRHENSSDTNN